MRCPSEVYELPAELQYSLSLVSMLTRYIGEGGAVRISLFTGHGRFGCGGGRSCADFDLAGLVSLDEPAGLDPPGVPPPATLLEVAAE